MFCSMLACGQNGEIGLNGELPWEGQYPEDREFYEGQTELALRIGTRGAIALFLAKQALLSNFGESAKA